MASITVRNARYHARNATTKAREEAESARARADWIRDSGHYSPDGVAEFVGERVGRAKTATEAAFEVAVAKVQKAREASESKLREALTVPTDERAAAAAVLAPVIDAATANDPKALISLYETRAPQSLADRLILEDAIQATLDAGLGGMGFGEEWGRLRNAMTDHVETPAERAALEDLAALEGLGGYVASAKHVVGGELATAETGEADMYSVSGVTARFNVDSFERRMDEGTVDEPLDITPQDVSGVPEAGAPASQFSGV